MSSPIQNNLTHSQQINNEEETIGSSTEDVLDQTIESDDEEEMEYYIPTAIPHWLELMMEEDVEQIEEDIEDLNKKEIK